MDGLVVGLGRQAFEDLEGEANAKGDRVGVESCKRAVVVTATASEALAAGGESKTGDQYTIKCGGTDPFAMDGFLESSVCVRRRMQVLRGRGGAPEEVRAVNTGKDKPLGGMLQKGEEVGLPRNGGEEGNGVGGGPDRVVLDLGEKRVGAFLGDACCGLEAGAHEAAEDCFGVGDLWGN